MGNALSEQGRSGEKINTHVTYSVSVRRSCCARSLPKSKHILLIVVSLRGSNSIQSNRARRATRAPPP
jgi:hypothetical protein